MKDHESTRITRRSIPGVTLHPRDGYWQIRHIGLTKERVKTDPAFYKTRQQAKELAQLAAMSKLLHQALLPDTGIRKMQPRLMPLLKKALAADTAHTPGHRSWQLADWSLLQGFECNGEAPFHAVVDVPPIIQIHAAASPLTVTWPPFNPATAIQAPAAITHARLYIQYVVLDTVTGTAQGQKHRTTLFPLKPIRFQSSGLQCRPIQGDHYRHLLATGIEWYDRAPGQSSLLPAEHPHSLFIAKAW